MGVFNAVRKYMLQDDIEAADSTTRVKADGIVVVGDGSTRAIVLLMDLYAYVFLG